MFTGIVQQQGRVRSAKRVPFGLELVVDACGWSHVPEPGASIAVNGCCLTATGDAPPGHLRFLDVIQQTLAETTLGDLAPDDAVNLEHAATPTTLLGGHIVQGHIDGVGVVRDVEQTPEAWRTRVEPPPALLPYIVERGSIALDGVSLTLATVHASTFEVALIPTTLAETTLGRTAAGDRVNIETDCLARMVGHWLERRGSA